MTNHQNKRTIKQIPSSPLVTHFSPPMHQKRATYSWMKGNESDFPLITKDYFRCRGSTLNPPRQNQIQTGKPSRIYDCGGMERHSLPLKDGKEYVYPILIDLLNHIQCRLKKRVVITSGHKCPEHNKYVDSSTENQCSKHLIGAEASFYVQGLEQNPEAIVEEIFHFYKKNLKYENLSEYQTFSRYSGNTNVSTLPWFNKEVFIKIFRSNEGRNFDNRHPFPYISIQVRYDWDEKKKVEYSWKLANRNYLRY